MELFKRKKLIVVYYVNVMGVKESDVKQKLLEYSQSYFQFADDKNVKEMCVPTNGESRVEFVRI